MDINKKQKIWTIDMVPAFTGIIIAVISLVLSIYQFRSSEENTKLSVRPLLHMKMEWYGNLQGDKELWFKLILINSGLGPARLLNWDIDYKGNKPVDNKELVEAIQSDFNKNIRQLAEKILLDANKDAKCELTINYNTFKINPYLLSDKEITLFSIEPGCASKVASEELPGDVFENLRTIIFEKLKTLIDTIQVNLCYESLYHEKASAIIITENISPNTASVCT
jgi:hypothetical protein